MRIIRIISSRNWNKYIISYHFWNKFLVIILISFLKKLYLCSQMQKSDKIINIILALVALGLLALCIASVMH